MSDEIQRYSVIFSFSIKKGMYYEIVSGSRGVVVPAGMDVTTFIKQEFAKYVTEATASENLE